MCWLAHVLCYCSCSSLDDSFRPPTSLSLSIARECCTLRCMLALAQQDHSQSNDYFHDGPEMRGACVFSHEKDDQCRLSITGCSSAEPIRAKCLRVALLGFWHCGFRLCWLPAWPSIQRCRSDLHGHVEARGTLIDTHKCRTQILNETNIAHPALFDMGTRIKQDKQSREPRRLTFFLLIVGEQQAKRVARAGKADEPADAAPLFFSFLPVPIFSFLSF